MQIVILIKGNNDINVTVCFDTLIYVFTKRNFNQRVTNSHFHVFRQSLKKHPSIVKKGRGNSAFTSDRSSKVASCGHSVAGISHISGDHSNEFEENEYMIPKVGFVTGTNKKQAPLKTLKSSLLSSSEKF